MWKIYFIRHNKLLSNYSNYCNLSYKDANNLISLISSPNISSVIPKNDFLGKLNIDDIDYVITSKQRRTFKTAKLLWVTKVSKSDKLNMKFSFKELWIKKNVKWNYIKLARENIFKYLVSEKWKNKYNLIFENIKIIIKQCLKNENSLIITHWFLLKFMYLYLFLWKDKNYINLHDFNEIDFDYMEWFIINKENLKNYNK